MSPRRVLAPDARIVPAADGRFELRRGGSAVLLDADQLPLLSAFERGSTIDEALEMYSSAPEEARRVLETCAAEGLLLPYEADKGVAWPDREHVFETLFGTPNHAPEHPVAFSFLGVPFDGGTTGEPGARFGPRTIREGSQSMRYDIHPLQMQPCGFWDQAASRMVLEGVWMSDAGDIVLPPGATAYDLRMRVESAVRELLESGAIPVLLGGDHSLTYPALAAYPRSPIGVIQIDAHTDLGALEIDRVHHGNVFRAVLERLDHVDRIVTAGLRGYLSGAEDQTHMRATAIGISKVYDGDATAILEAAPDDIPYYLSIDIDAVDPAFAPSTGTPVPGGLTPHALFSLVRRIGLERHIVGMDITEVAAASGPGDPTGQLAATTILTALSAITERMTRALRPAD